jgi:hypothetical protein
MRIATTAAHKNLFYFYFYVWNSFPKNIAAVSEVKFYVLFVFALWFRTFKKIAHIVCLLKLCHNILFTVLQRKDSSSTIAFSRGPHHNNVCIPTTTWFLKNKNVTEY